MNQIKTLTEKLGEGSREVRQSQSGDFNRAGSGSPTTNWGVIAQLQVEADEMEQQIEDMLDADPVGASKSFIGILVLSGYQHLMDGSYPYKFEASDLIKDGMCIQAQLVAEEYFEGSKESCPLTPQAFENWCFEKNRKKPKEWVDPFTTNERPDVTIEYVEKMQRVNFDPSKSIQDKPELKEWTPF